MDSLIETFHIDIMLLIAQMVNFAIVISVLYFLALKPLLATMKDRAATIEKSLVDAKKINRQLEEAESEYKNTLIKAKKEANTLIEQARELAEKKREEMLAKAKEEIGQIILDEKESIRQERMKTLKEIKKETAELAVALAEKILDKRMDSQEDKEIIKKIFKKTD